MTQLNELYEKVWKLPEYRISAPGEFFVSDFLRKARPTDTDTVVDLGCGSGRAAREIAKYCKVIALDFADNCLDDDVRGVHDLEFRVHDLTKPIGRIADYGFCTDVMEHIPPEDVDTVLKNVCESALKVYFNISTREDGMGPLVGHTLHLTVKPYEWWKEKLESIGFRIDFSQDLGEDESCVFWGSVYANGQDVSDITSLNVSESKVKDNIIKNLSLGFNEICPHEKQDELIYLLAGGPSLAEHENEIKLLGKLGAKFITVNGTYKWLIDRGIRPAAHFMVDGRDFNERFIHKIVDTCKYIFSSQASHEALKKVPKEQGWLYHSGDSPLLKEILEEHARGRGEDLAWWPVYGGTTVVLRALVVLAMLGFRKIEVFGWDSCLMGEKHHAYEQKENDSRYVIDVVLGGRTFRCHPWMVVQANEFPKLIRYILGLVEGFELNVRGDGLIAHILETASKRAAQQGEENGC